MYRCMKIFYLYMSFSRELFAFEQTKDDFMNHTLPIISYHEYHIPCLMPRQLAGQTVNRK